jgi:hypothetical protein
MLEGHHQGQLILQDFRGLQLGIARHERDGTHVEAVVQHLVGYIAREHPVHPHLHSRMHLAEPGEGRKQRVDGAFVYAQGKLSSLQALQLRKPFLYFVSQIQQALRVIFQQNARIGQPHRPGAAHEEWLAQGILQFADAQANRRLRAVEAFRRP